MMKIKMKPFARYSRISGENLQGWRWTEEIEMRYIGDEGTASLNFELRSLPLKWIQFLNVKTNVYISIHYIHGEYS